MNVKKVKAHPERREGEWSKDDEGIFIADKVAGNVGNIPTVTATEVIGEVARRGKIMICGENGEPFIGNLRMRCSKEKLRRYWKRRDEYREERGRRPMWEGTNIDLSHKMMGKSKSLEDLSAVQRMSCGKRWCNSWANKEKCKACGTGTRSEAHALRTCGAEEVRILRRGWTEAIGKVIHKVTNQDLRGVMEEMWMRMRYNVGGEMAMMGCFTPGWVETISKARMELRDGEDRRVMNVLRKIGEGSREIIRRYYEIEKCQKVGKELRQSNIRGFYGVNGRGVDKPIEITRRNATDKKRKSQKGGNTNGQIKAGYNVYIQDSFIYWESKEG